MTSVMTTEKNWLGILHTGTLPHPSLWSLVLRYMTFPVFAIILSCLLHAKSVSFVCVGPFESVLYVIGRARSYVTPFVNSARVVSP